MIKEHDRNMNELLQEQIIVKQKLNFDVSNKETEIVMLNKKIKNLNYSLMLYQDQVKKFNSGKK